MLANVFLFDGGKILWLMADQTGPGLGVSGKLWLLERLFERLP